LPQVQNRKNWREIANCFYVSVMAAEQQPKKGDMRREGGNG